MDSLAQILKSAFDPVFPAPVQAWEQFASFCELMKFPAEHEQKAAGTTERYGYFILEGSMGIFLMKDHAEVCLDLGYELTFFGDYMSLISSEPSPLSTRTLEPVQALRISRSNIDSLKATPLGQQIFLAAAESSFVDKQRQQIDLLTKSAVERYEELLQRHPAIILRTPQKYIASYLGITPQSLSRIRRQVSGTV
ncbi:MAG: Crp/Fnr family transcriptional regulator [Cyclobacteriaceae bacterium]|nr:Crp/Fnr family transcriptional regulator [Cyclobacteriaceae bacterium]